MMKESYFVYLFLCLFQKNKLKLLTNYFINNKLFNFRSIDFVFEKSSDYPGGKPLNHAPEFAWAALIQGYFI